MNNHYPRREFVLHVLAACGTSLLVPSLVLGGQQLTSPATTVPAKTGPGPTAAEYFGYRLEAARAAGMAYLKQMGRDTSQASVMAATRDTAAVIDGALDQREAVDTLVSAVRQDFREGRSIQVEGWVLSRTEAELCALTLLSTAN